MKQIASILTAERLASAFLVLVAIEVVWLLFFTPDFSTIDQKVAEDLKFITPPLNKKSQPSQKDTLLDDIAKLEQKNEQEFEYDPTGKRDPFKPFDFSPKQVTPSGKTPLERYDLAQLRLTAIILGFDEPVAIVENAAGKGFSVRIGTRIGTHGGYVTKIEKDRIVIREEFIDFTGRKKARDIEMRLRIKKTEE